MSILSKCNLTHPEILRQHTIQHISKKRIHSAIYTDGSKSDKGVGAAAIAQNICMQVSLPHIASVFTAELVAIHSALDIISQERPSYSVIYCDSRSAISAIAQYTPTNQLVLQIQALFHKLSVSGLSVELCWVPAHVGITGNERADAAAKEACSLPVSLHDLPVGDWLITIKSLVFNDWQLSWDAIPNSNKLKTIKTSVLPWT